METVFLRMLRCAMFPSVRDLKYRIAVLSPRGISGRQPLLSKTVSAAVHPHCRVRRFSVTTASHVRLQRPSFFHRFSSWSSALRSSAEDFQKRPFLHTVSAVYFGKPITSTVSFSGPMVVAQDQATATVAFGFDFLHDQGRYSLVSYPLHQLPGRLEHSPVLKVAWSHLLSFEASLLPDSQHRWFWRSRAFL